PWERRRGLRAIFLRARGIKAIAVLCGIGAFALLSHLERQAGAVRATRVAITDTTNAVDAWRADHEGACPRAPSELVAGGYLSEMPRDAWGKLLRLTCPGRRDPAGFDVWSDGPDGEPGGLDRVQ
ncbi:MAG: type II secretion system protein GspG, partial [Polyangiaceae bacterium]